jgi:membrane fusion protein (multidrug efflux system)
MSSTVLGRDTIALPAHTKSRVTPKRVALLALLATLGAGAVWYGTDWWQTGRFVESTDDAYVGGNITTISPHVPGFISAILVADNQRVQAGQLLIQLDPRDTQAVADRAQAVLDARRATLANLQAEITLQDATIAQAVAERAAKTAQANFAHVDGIRYAVLAQTAAGSRQDAQRTQAAEQEANAALIASGASLEAARARLKVLDAQIAEAKAGIDQALSEQRTTKLDLGYTQIRSPIDGYIGNRAAQQGAYVSTGSYLLSVVPVHGLWVDANFKEDQLARMLPGQHAAVVADVAPGKTLHGHVESLAPGTGAVFSVIPPENATGNFTKIVQRVPVRIAIDAQDAAAARLRPGLSVTVGVDTKSVPTSVP